MQQFEVITTETLTTVVGGAAERPSDDGQPEPRTWGQVGREYAAACVTGAGQALMFSGMPRNARQAATTAAFGCATGVGMKAVDDLAGAISR